MFPISTLFFIIIGGETTHRKCLIIIGLQLFGNALKDVYDTLIECEVHSYVV